MSRNANSDGPGEFSRPLSIEDIDFEKAEFVVEPTAEECEALSERLDVINIANLVGAVSFSRRGNDGLQARISLTAEVTQTCGITLDPVDERIDEQFDISFLPGDGFTGENSLDLDIAGDGPPEPIMDGVIDLGELISQLLAVSIDPYPRKRESSAKSLLGAGAALNGVEGHGGEGTSEGGPFSELQKLKNRLN